MSVSPANSCSQCGTAMIRGNAALKTSVTGFLLSGFSSQDLWFESPKKKQCVMTSSEVVPAFFCESCEAIFIPRKQSLGEKISEAGTQVSSYLKERRRTSR